MGTNFYIRGYRHDDGPDYHIGKRSAAGLYCWDCRISFCKAGEEKLHYGRGNDNEWYNKCPKCGKKHIKESLNNSSAGRELGFNHNKPQKKKGVAGCCSFNWAMSQERFCEAIQEVIICPCCRRKYSDKNKVIENEYCDLFTLEEFYDILKECPIIYTNMIGESFS